MNSAHRPCRPRRATQKSALGSPRSANETAGAATGELRFFAPLRHRRGAIIEPMVEPRPDAPIRSSDDPFTDFVLPELEVMYRVARSLTRNPTDAEDLVQDTLIRAYKAIDRFDGRYPRAWLLTIMRNAQLNRVRRKRPELMRDPDLTMQRVADTSEDGRNVEDQVLEGVFDERVENALDALPEKFRAVIEMVDMNGLAYQEAADVLGVPVGTVMSRLHRARKRIRDDLEKSGISRRSSVSPSGQDHHESEAVTIDEQEADGLSIEPAAAEIAE